MNCESQSTSSTLFGIAKDIERIAEMLAEHGETDHQRVPRTGLHVSEKEGRVYWNGHQLPINGNRDFELFLILYRARGEIISQTKLFRHICPGITSDAVEQLNEQEPELKDALHQIRRACRKIGAPDFIEVVRGRGYRLRNLSQ